jgi:hypothetical protein
MFPGMYEADFCSADLKGEGQRRGRFSCDQNNQFSVRGHRGGGAVPRLSSAAVSILIATTSSKET